MATLGPRIALIHATSVAIEPIRAAFVSLWPEARTTNLLEDSLSADLAEAGQLHDAITARLRATFRAPAPRLYCLPAPRSAPRLKQHGSR